MDTEKTIECEGVSNVIDEKVEEPKKEDECIHCFSEDRKHGIGEIEVGYGN